MRRTVPRERLNLETNNPGLTSHEVSKRLRDFGPNSIIDATGARRLGLLIDTLRDPMLWFLVIVASLFAITGEWREAAVLLVALAPLTGMDAFLHWRTAISTQNLQRRLATTATVLREGGEQVVAVRDIVPGDVLIVRAGETIAADGIVLGAREAQIDESPLTGESLPIVKSVIGQLPQGVAPQIETIFWGFAGTKVLMGEIKLCIAYTGNQTLYGEILQSVATSRQVKTPLQLAVNRLVRRLVGLACCFCIILASARLLQGKGVVDAVVSAATLALAAIPEEFPVVFTFFLGVGVFRMARRKALVRRAVSVENIGRVTVICSDKTGTLTEGRLRLAHVLPADSATSADIKRAAALASRADSFDPMDQTILEEFRHGTLPKPIAVFPFTESRRREVTVIQESDAVLFAAKGAPETIIALCNLSTDEVARHLENVRQLAREGHKVLACAMLERAHDTRSLDEPTGGYRFLGLLAFEDPPRPEVPAAIKICQRAGIHVIMVTGDHPATAEAIAREIGLGGDSPRVRSIEDAVFSPLSWDFLQTIDVIARAMPGQKLAIVRALRARGEIVAVTGDGINDVPALQAADVGIAMGLRGTRSARDVAAIVLVDDNFATVVAAIAEGRQLLVNLRQSFQYLIMVHIPLVGTAAILPLLGLPLLYLPIHVVWIELVIHPTAMLAFQHMAYASIERATSKVSTTLLTRPEWVLCCIVGLVLTVSVGGFFVAGFRMAWEVDRSRTLAILSLVLGSACAGAMLGKLSTPAARVILASTVLSTVVFTEVPFLSKFMHLVALTFQDWLMISVAVALIVVVVESLRDQGRTCRR